MINLFDLGMNDGVTAQLMIDSVEGQEYRLYGFEATEKWFNYCVDKFKDNPRVVCIHKAISNNEEKAKLYKCTNDVGHSLFKDKFNVDENKFEYVDSIIFSKWFIKNIPIEDTNILKLNIEGAEYYFFKDIINSGVYKKLAIICGTNDDVTKIKSLSGELNEYYKLIKDHNITVHYFSHYEMHKNVNLKEMILSLKIGGIA